MRAVDRRNDVRNAKCEGCGHFGGRHVHGRDRCRDCGCPQMMITLPESPPPRSRRFTAEETAQCQELLEQGLSYAQVARKVGRGRDTIAAKFPGYSANSQAAIELSKAALKAFDERYKRRQEARRALREADDIPMRYGCRYAECDGEYFASGLCKRHYRQWTRRRRR